MTSPTAAIDPNPAIQTLADRDQRLGIVCDHCTRFRYLNAGRYAAGTRLSAISAALTCARCGSKEVKAVAVSRDPNNGYWPAERS